MLVVCATCGGGVDVGPAPEVDATSLDPDVVGLFRARIAQIEKTPRDAELRARLGMAYEANMFGLIAATEDMREGLKAFLDKRSADFRNR